MAASRPVAASIAHQEARPRVAVGPLLLDRVSMPEVLEAARNAIHARTPCHIVTANAQFLTQAARDPAFAAAVNDARLVLADGMPAVWLSKLAGAPVPGRLTGHDLLLAFAALAQEEGYSLFFLGATAQVAQEVGRRLQAQFPGLRIAGAYQGAFTRDGYGQTEADERGALEAVRRAAPDLLFVALGCPKQEFWVHRHLHALEVPVYVGVGCVLDVFAGRRTRAPRWMQRAGLEWLYRLRQEPGRLAGRYARDAATSLRLLGAVAVERGLRRRPHAPPVPGAPARDVQRVGP